ncbi:hypothetical protein BaRGS_00026311 [Batillaria attramentaria]|uniref:Uncharacterized protein n=1 Tax=Batillaria attramentaria TaxID=370345 RepID=A0ABD0K5J2_9CAEN
MAACVKGDNLRRQWRVQRFHEYENQAEEGRRAVSSLWFGPSLTRFYAGFIPLKRVNSRSNRSLQRCNIETDPYDPTEVFGNVNNTTAELWQWV